MNAVELATILLAWVFGVHIPLVYTVLGVLWTLPALEYASRGDGRYMVAVKGIARYLIAVYAVGGVFGTIITVFLAGMLPVFTNLAGVLLWPVWATAIAFGVAIALPLIGYWYRTLGHMSPGRHAALGFLTAGFTTVIPLMFRLVFAVVNYPAGVEVVNDPSSLVGFDLVVRNYWALFSNPTYPPLILSTLLGAVAFSNALITFVYGYSSSNPEVVSMSRKVALTFGAAAALSGVWYLFELYYYAPTMAWSILGGMPSTIPASLATVFMPTYSLVAPFIAAVILGLVSAVALLMSSRIKSRALNILGLLTSIATVIDVEEVNLLSHLPYAIIPPVSAAEELASQYGVNFALTVAKVLSASTMTTTLNALAVFVSADPAVLYFSMAFFALFTVLVLVGIYMALSWRRGP
ncbi:MAG: cytochrome ubiquinol oxidase subunit I [Conexivisphaerales archaeon]|nr:cytochrome ubiquinol oxidase subunit I [Conexivisphaerales archaeon]